MYRDIHSRGCKGHAKDCHVSTVCKDDLCGGPWNDDSLRVCVIPDVPTICCVSRDIMTVPVIKVISIDGDTSEGELVICDIEIL